MCTVLLCMISLHYSSLFSCYQLCLEGFWIFSILNIVAVDILVYVPCCLCVCFSGDALSVKLLSGAYLQLCQRTSPCCPQEPVCCSPECICDRVEPHLLQYLTSSAFGIFAHWWGVKWYRPVSSFHAAFPDGSEVDHPLLHVCWPSRLLLLLIVCSSGTPFSLLVMGLGCREADRPSSLSWHMVIIGLSVTLLFIHIF